MEAAARVLPSAEDATAKPEESAGRFVQIAPKSDEVNTCADKPTTTSFSPSAEHAM